VSLQAVLDVVAHKAPADLRDALVADAAALEKWGDITPLARNEWICWVESVKTAETRAERVPRTESELREGIRRPCCWMGCVHRTDKPMSASQKWVLSRGGGKQ